MAECIPNDLLDDGRCFQCSNEQQFWMMALQLLCDIGASSGGGGVQRVWHGPSDPNGSVVAPDPSIYYGDDGSLWVKTNGITDDQGWEPLMGAFMPEVNRVADAPVQVVLATNRLDPELVFAPMLTSNFVKTPEPSAAVKKNADSFLKRLGGWFSANIWIWSFIFVMAVLTDSAQAIPPPFLRNEMDTNATIVGVGLTIVSAPGTTTLTVTGSGLTNANDILTRLLTNGAIRTLSGGAGIVLTNQGSNIVIAATGSGSTLTNANDVLDRLLTNNSIRTLSITGGSISNQGTNLHFTVSPSSALTNTNPVLLSWLTNGGAAIKTVSAGSGVVLTNEGGTNIVIAATASASTLTNANDILNRLLTNNSIRTLSITGGSISNQGTNLHFTVTASGSQTPLLQDVNGAFFMITNLSRVQAGSMSAAASAFSAASPARLQISNTNNSGAIIENTAAIHDGPFVSLHAAPGVAITNTARLGGFLIGGTSASTTYRNATLLTSFAAENWVDGSAYGAGFRVETTATGGTARTTKLTINAGGGIQFNTYGAGTITSDAAGNLTAISDEAMKVILGPYNHSLNRVLGLQPIQFRWRASSGNETNHTYAGFSAQNVQEYLPDAAGMMIDGTLAMQDRTVIAALVNSVKDLNQKIERQDQRILQLLRALRRLTAQDSEIIDMETNLVAQPLVLPTKHPQAPQRLLDLIEATRIRREKALENSSPGGI